MGVILNILIAAYMGYSADNAFRDNRNIWGALFLALAVLNLASACIGMGALNG